MPAPRFAAAARPPRPASTAIPPRYTSTRPVGGQSFSSVKKMASPDSIASELKNSANLNKATKKIQQVIDFTEDPLKFTTTWALRISWTSGIFGLVTGAVTLLPLIVAAVAFAYIHIHWIAHSMGNEHFCALGEEWVVAPAAWAGLAELVFLFVCDIILLLVALALVAILVLINQCMNDYNWCRANIPYEVMWEMFKIYRELPAT